MIRYLLARWLGPEMIYPEAAVASVEAQLAELGA